MTGDLILGLNAIGFNTSSALLKGGVPLFAVEEERMIREKRTRRFPLRGIQAALQLAQASVEDLDCVAVAWNPGVNLESFSLAQSERSRYLPEGVVQRAELPAAAASGPACRGDVAAN